MAFDLVKNYNKNSENLKIISYKKIRFKMLVKPEEMLYINVKLIGKNTYSFKITSGENITCSGTMTV